MGLNYLLLQAESGQPTLIPGLRGYLLLATPEEESRLRRALFEQRWSYDVVASGEVGPAGQPPVPAEVERQLPELSAVVLTSSGIQSDEVAELALTAHVQGTRVMDFESALIEIDPTVPSSALPLLRMLSRHATPQGGINRLYTTVKYALEPALALVVLVLLSPVIAAVAFAIRLTSPGPVFYRQTRRGLKGKPFDMVKFRSMRIDAESSGPVWASARTNDARLTPIGGFLRATHLDEIPQLWNVARGELSIVGPRPERPVFCEKIEAEVPLFRLRTLVKPGVTGWAQIRQGYANTMDDSRRKLEFDLFYILKHSPWMDLMIVLGTVLVVFSGGTEGRKRDRLEGVKAPRRRSPIPGLARRRTEVREADKAGAAH